MLESNEVSETSRDVPFRVRWRFAVGLRLPDAYVDWAIAEVNKDAWPVRQVFVSFIAMVAPGTAFMSLLLTLPLVLFDDRSWSSGGMGLMVKVVWPTYLILGSFLGAYRGDYRRRLAIAHLRKMRRT